MEAMSPTLSGSYISGFIFLGVREGNHLQFSRSQRSTLQTPNQEATAYASPDILSRVWQQTQFH
jgi:hypothetical protein